MTRIDYFQLASVSIVLLVIVGKAVYSWITTGINPVVIGRGQGWWRVIELLSSLSVVLWIIEVALRALHSRFVIFPHALPVALLHTPAAKGLGVFFVILGVTLLLLAYLSFGASWRMGIDRQTPGALVTNGIFAVSRNPIYVGSILCFIGIFLINGTWFFLIFTLLAIVGIHFEILREEDFLMQQHGAEFSKYRERTARYLIW